MLGAITPSEASSRPSILELFAGFLTEVDHLERMERFLSRENWVSAIRAAGYAGKDQILLAKARIAVAQDATDGQIGTRGGAGLPSL